MADSKITALTAISTVDPAADPLVIVDVSDTSMAASGTTKKATINQLLGASGTATLASATISGAANFNGGALAAYLNGSLLVGSSGNYVNIYGQSNGLIVKDSTGVQNLFSIATAGVFTFGDGAGGTRMTLDSNGLGVGAAPTLEKLQVNGGIVLSPPSTPATLTTNGQLTVNATSNTNLRFSYRGSDGVTRTTNLTLA